VAVDAAVLGSDHQAFVAALAARDLPAAVARYGGPFLDGLAIHDAPEFEHWADAERARLARLHGEALEGLARAASLRGDTARRCGGGGRWWTPPRCRAGHARADGGARRRRRPARRRWTWRASTRRSSAPSWASCPSPR
jgi:hypothetical protein